MLKTTLSKNTNGINFGLLNEISRFIELIAPYLSGCNFDTLTEEQKTSLATTPLPKEYIEDATIKSAVDDYLSPNVIASLKRMLGAHIEIFFKTVKELCVKRNELLAKIDKRRLEKGYNNPEDFKLLSKVNFFYSQRLSQLETIYAYLGKDIPKLPEYVTVAQRTPTPPLTMSTLSDAFLKNHILYSNTCMRT